MDKSNHADRARFRPPNKAHARGDRRINRINAEPEVIFPYVQADPSRRKGQGG